MLIGIGHVVFEETIPLGIGEGIAVQLFQLSSQIGYELCLGMDRQIRIPLFGEHANEFLFQIRFALIAVGASLYRFIFCYNRVVARLSNNIEKCHLRHLHQNNYNSESIPLLAISSIDPISKNTGDSFVGAKAIRNSFCHENLSSFLNNCSTISSCSSLIGCGN